MALVADIIRDVLMEIGVLDSVDTPTAEDQQLVLRYLQRQIDAWAADRMTLSAQLRTVFTLVSGTTTVTLGPTGTVVMDTPTWVNTAMYIIPGAVPNVESPIAIYDQDAYAAITIKTLSSSLPTALFYQTNLADSNGTATFWPQVNQNVQIVLYTPQGIAVPASVNTVLIGPKGYAEAFHYQLARRCAKPFGVTPDQLLIDNAEEAWMVMKRPNIRPAVMGTDVAVTAPRGGYNILSDTWNSR